MQHSNLPTPPTIACIPVGEGHVEINTPTKDILTQRIRARLAAKEGFALATLNLDHLVKLSRSDLFRSAYAAQDFVVADGNPVVWLSRLAGQRVELVPGADMVRPLAQLAADTGQSVALLGSTEETLKAAASTLTAEIPRLTIAGCFAPPFGFDPTSDAADHLLDEVAASGAGLVFLALGAPKQEILAARGRLRTPHLGFASIGAGVDFIAGTQKRAPAGAQRFALEWLWRWLRDPRRLTERYMRCIAILPGLAFRCFRSRHQSR